MLNKYEIITIILSIGILCSRCTNEKTDLDYFHFDQHFTDSLECFQINENKIVIKFYDSVTVQQWSVDCEVRDRRNDSFLFRIDGYKAMQENGHLTIEHDELLKYKLEDLKIQFHLLNDSYWYIKDCEVWKFSYFINKHGRIQAVKNTTSGRFARFDYVRFTNEKSKAVRSQVNQILDSLQCD